MRDNGYQNTQEKPLVLQGVGTEIAASLFTRDPNHFDHFNGDTIDLNQYVTTTDAGATAFAIPATQLVGGAIEGACGATDSQVAMIAGGLTWRANTGGLVFEVRLKLSAITTVAASVGLSDARTEATTLMPVDENADTLTTTATDGVFWYFDTDSTVPATDVWTAIGVKAGVDTTATDGAAPVADTYETLRIEVSTTGTAKWLQNGVLKKKVANAVTATVLLCPFVAIAARTTASRTMTVDYLGVAQKLA